MQKGPKPAELTLSEEEHRRLEALVHRHTTPQQLAKRGRMILGAAEGKRNAEIARELGVSVDTVRSWRGRWISLQAVPLSELSVAERLEDVPRPGKPSQITTENAIRWWPWRVINPKNARSVTGRGAKLPMR